MTLDVGESDLRNVRVEDADILPSDPSGIAENTINGRATTSKFATATTTTPFPTQPIIQHGGGRKKKITVTGQRPHPGKTNKPTKKATPKGTASNTTTVDEPETDTANEIETGTATADIPATDSATVSTATVTDTATEPTELALLASDALATCTNGGSGVDCQACSDKFYGNRIAIDPALYSATDAVANYETFSAWAARELVGFLQNTTGQGFSVVQDDGTTTEPGIFLLKSTSSRVTSSTSTALKEKLAALNASTSEATLFHTNEHGQLWIIAGRELTVKHAAYEYLQRLGYRWYGSTDTWMITPSRTHICLSAGTEGKYSDFASVSYFGTGAYGGDMSAIGYSGTAVSDRNMAFYTRNALPWMYRIGGHDYGTFIKAKLSAGSDPLSFAEIAGTRLVYDGSNEWTVQLNYTHNGTIGCDDPKATISYTDASGTPHCENATDFSSDGGVIKAYGDYKVAELESAVASDPDSVHSRFVSVDPNDGSTICSSIKCKNILRHGGYTLDDTGKSDDDASGSDMVFHLANKVAEKIAAAFGEGALGASILAYNEHLAVPSIPLHPKLHVEVVPYAFNQTGQTPEELLIAWMNKAAQEGFGTGVYAYGCLPDWYFDVPRSVCSWREFTDRMVDWHAMGLEQVTVEESTGMGIAGLNNYLLSRLAWDADLDRDALVDEFYETAFGAAKAPIQAYYDSFGDFSTSLTSSNVATLCQDLVDANTLWQNDQDPGVGARLDDLKKYVHYIQLAYDVNKAWNDYYLSGFSDNSFQGAHVTVLGNLLEWIWRIRNSDMVMTYRLHQEYQAAFYSFGDAYKTLFDTTWNLSDYAASPGFTAMASLPDPTTDELNASMIQCAAYPRSAVTSPATYTASDYIALYPDTADTSMVDTPPLTGTYFTILAKNPGTQNLSIQYGGGTLNVKLYDAAGELLMAKDLTNGGGGDWQTLALNFPAAGQYELDVTGTPFYLRYPKNLPLATTGEYAIYNTTPPDHFIYVPDGTSAFNLTMVPGTDTNLQFVRSDGKTAAWTKLGYNTYEVNTGGVSGVWTVKFLTSTTTVDFVNIPKVISWSKESMIVPSDALK